MEPCDRGERGGGCKWNKTWARGSVKPCDWGEGEGVQMELDVGLFHGQRRVMRTTSIPQQLCKISTMRKNS